MKPPGSGKPRKTGHPCPKAAPAGVGGMVSLPLWAPCASPGN